MKDCTCSCFTVKSVSLSSLKQPWTELINLHEDDAFLPLHRWVKLSEWVRNYRIKDGGIGLKQMEEKKSEHSVKLWKCTVHLFCVHLIFHYIYWPMSGWWALREFVHITRPRLNSDHLVIFVLVLTTQGYSCSATFEDRHSSQLLVCSWIQKLLSIWRGN